MWWQVGAGASAMVALCFLVISGLIVSGVIRTRRLSSNRLGVSTAAIFAVCAAYFGYTALHLMLPVRSERLEAARATFNGLDSVLIQCAVAACAVAYLISLMLSRDYAVLWNSTAVLDVRTAAQHRASGEPLTDRLTGVPNRVAYSRYAQGLVNDERWMIVLFIDLDGLEAFNNEHGRDAGDRLLRDIAQRLAGSLGSTERLFHLGGDEFAVIGLGHDTAQAASLYTRTETVLARPIAMSGHDVVVSSSLGVATGHANAGVDSLLRKADASVYRAKSLRRRPPTVTQI